MYNPDYYVNNYRYFIYIHCKPCLHDIKIKDIQICLTYETQFLKAACTAAAMPQIM